MSRGESKDGETEEQLLAPPNLDDGVESLDYWRRRRQQLPWHRIRARREATRMIVRWEQRVSAAILSEQHASLENRFTAGALVARTRLSRWTRRVGIAVLATATTAVVLVTVLVAAVVSILLHAF